MADINLAPYTAEQQAIDRRRKMAEALQQQAVAPIEMPNMPGVRVSPLQGLAKLLQGYIAGKNLSRADKEQKDYENLASEDTARFLRNMGQFETVPGEVTTQGMPAQAPMINGAIDLREGPDRALPTQRPTIDGAIELADNEKFVYPANPSTINGAIDLRKGEDRVLPANPPMIDGVIDLREGAIPAEAISQARSPARQIPLLNASLLEPTNPLAFKTSQGRQLLAQYLMQQEAQKQAAAQAEAAAARQIHTLNPEQTAGRFVNGQFVPLIQGQPKPMTESQRLDAQAKIYAAQVEAEKARDTGRTPIQFEPLPKGVPIGAKRIGIDPTTKKPVYELNGERFVGE